MTESENPPQKSAGERWAEIRRRGPWSYILRRGILIPGAIFAALRLLDDYFESFTSSHPRGMLERIRREVDAQFDAPIQQATGLQKWWLNIKREQEISRRLWNLIYAGFAA
jgi:hypothetical protein